ncbi:MAG TPA: hypothetical protein VN857_04450 [Chthoniobacterales bacterium]|nr:hypothetical protein [Chthoniobacterales bacterium]
MSLDRAKSGREFHCVQAIMIAVRSDTACTLNFSARKQIAIFSRSAGFSPATKIVTPSRLIYLYVKQVSNGRHFLPGF